MFINLSKSVQLKELCRVTAAGDKIDEIHLIEFTLSREAILGFATELLWLFDGMKDNKKLNLNINQLQVDPAPGQLLGFYLTPDSPMLVLKVNSLREYEECEYVNCKEIRIREKNINQYYNIKTINEDEKELITLENYELSKRNIMSISIFDSYENNITGNFYNVFFEINHKGLKDFATMLLVWANNCNEGDEYILPNIERVYEGYNLGVVLDYENVKVKFKCNNLGDVYSYDSRM